MKTFVVNYDNGNVYLFVVLDKPIKPSKVKAIQENNTIKPQELELLLELQGYDPVIYTL